MIVLNNFGDGMVKQWQKLFHKGRHRRLDEILGMQALVSLALRRPL